MEKIKIMATIIFMIILLGIIIALIINEYVKFSSKNKIIKELTNQKKYEAILVLGCEVKSDGSLSLMLRDRLDKGIELYKAGISNKIIVSGDHENDSYNEVNPMRDYVVNNGVPVENVIMDHSGFSTYDSIYRAKNIYNLSNCIVVTQEYHLYRAIYIGNALGIDISGFPAVEVKYRGQTIRDIREILARDKDFIKCIIKPQSKKID